MAYHDEEWGRPVVDERGLYERLCLEGFQSGLSWLTILRKRENFRRAFAHFDPDAVARFGERDVQRLLGDAGIVRHRGKIEATIANARGVLELREAGTPLAGARVVVRAEGLRGAGDDGGLAVRDAESKELSKRLKAAGFRFVGPTTVWAAMQSCGVVNDHLATCWVRDEVGTCSTTVSAPSSPASSERMPQSASRAFRAAERSRQVARTTGQFLFALVAPQTDCEVLEIGGSRGYSTIWLAAGARYLGGRVLSLESDPRKIEAWRRNIAEAGLEEWAELVEGDAHETLATIDDVFDVVFLDAEKDDYERLFQLARERRSSPARSSSPTTCSPTPTRSAHYSAARQADPTLESVTIPLDRGLECERRPPLIAIYGLTAERRWSGSDFIKYGQWRYQRVEVRPRDLRGIA